MTSPTPRETSLLHNPPLISERSERIQFRFSARERAVIEAVARSSRTSFNSAICILIARGSYFPPDDDSRCYVDDTADQLGVSRTEATAALIRRGWNGMPTSTTVAVPGGAGAAHVPPSGGGFEAAPGWFDRCGKPLGGWDFCGLPSRHEGPCPTSTTATPGSTTETPPGSTTAAPGSTTKAPPVVPKGQTSILDADQ